MFWLQLPYFAPTDQDPWTTLLTSAMHGGSEAAAAGAATPTVTAGTAQAAPFTRARRDVGMVG
ncbi:hypothetical protein GCM10009584_19700 [Ornithinimicrobium humiphilum]